MPPRSIQAISGSFMILPMGAQALLQEKTLFKLINLLKFIDTNHKMQLFFQANLFR